MRVVAARASWAEVEPPEGGDRPNPQVRVLRSVTEHDRPEDFIETFCSLYTNAHTQHFRRKFLCQLFTTTGALHPADVSPAVLAAWITSPGANNTVRGRLATARVFFRWAVRQGHCESDPTAELGHITKSFPTTYGKTQSRYPARWLSHDEAYGQLLGTCDTSEARGLRDAIAIRLGLSGLRSNEIRTLTWAELHLGGTRPTINWTGKGRKARSVTPGRTLVSLINDWTGVWRTATGQLPQREQTLIVGADRHGQLAYGSMCGATAIFDIVRRRAIAAGLGNVSPHDLRRTAAGILHHSKTDDGGHRFDLLDIQKVLGHADPVTTMRSYLDPMDTGVQERAATVLD